MNIVICGAGSVGTHAAEVLAPTGHNITVVDQSESRLATIEETLDVRILEGNCASAETLAEAGAGTADILLGTTNCDEVNLLAASIAKGLGVKKSIARIHHGTYFENRGLDYLRHFQIDGMICPEYSTAWEIARSLRNPGALAIENFAGGRIEMQEFPVSPDAEAIGETLLDLRLPEGARLAAITRKGRTFIPDGTSVVEQGDVAILVGNSQIFQEARRRFRKTQAGQLKVAIMGGPAMAVWLCRVLRDRNCSIRVFESSRKRAEELADKLDWVTVLQGDPTEISTFEEERLSDVNVFVALMDDDENNILGCAWAKSKGVEKAIAIIQRPNYLHLLEHVGIDGAFSPRMVAVKEILNTIDLNPLRRIASLAEGVLDVYRVRVGPRATVEGKPLMEVKLSPNWVVAAIQRGEEVWLPTAQDAILAGDTVLVIGRHGMEKDLKTLFGAR